MATVTIATGDQVSKDPSDEKSYAVDWDRSNLAVGVLIVTSTWTITPIAPSLTDVALTKDNEVKLTAAQASALFLRTVPTDDRATQLRLKAGTLGQLYEIANKVVTNETPAQTKEKSFRVLVENL